MIAPNLLATNLGAEFIVLGEFQPGKEEFNTLAISRSHNGASLNSEEAQDALGGSSLPAGLMCSEASARGYDLTPDLIRTTNA